MKALLGILTSVVKEVKDETTETLKAIIPPKSRPQASVDGVAVTRILSHPNSLSGSVPTSYSIAFDLKSRIDLASRVIREFPALDRLRYSLVPRVMSENDFWCNFFYRLEFIPAQEDLAIAFLAKWDRCLDSSEESQSQEKNKSQLDSSKKTPLSSPQPPTGIRAEFASAESMVDSLSKSIETLRMKTEEIQDSEIAFLCGLARSLTLKKKLLSDEVAGISSSDLVTRIVSLNVEMDIALGSFVSFLDLLRKRGCRLDQDVVSLVDSLRGHQDEEQVVVVKEEKKTTVEPQTTTATQIEITPISIAAPLPTETSEESSENAERSMPWEM